MLRTSDDSPISKKRKANGVHRLRRDERAGAEMGSEAAQMPTPTASPPLLFASGETTQPEQTDSERLARSQRISATSALFSPSAVAKIWGVARGALDRASPPTEMPEYTPPGSSSYSYTAADFWTSGFFPGSLYLLLERAKVYPGHFPIEKLHVEKLRYACRWWSENLHVQAHRTDTHDLGFMILLPFQKDYELTGDRRSLDTLVTAANSLASRFEPRVGLIRSWDTCCTKRYTFEDPKADFLVIIDNMLNLNLLYWVSAQTGDLRLSSIATTHAENSLKHHIRHPQWSTVHVVNFDQETGAVKEKLTNQGYADDSTWSRGQAWGILGFAQCYAWTRKQAFLDAAINLGEYFVSRLDDGDGVPHWDFDAPRPTYRDTSAAMIAVCGFLCIYEATPEVRFLSHALRILDATLKMSLAPPARFRDDGSDAVDLGSGGDTILLNATINNHEFAPRRWADHGLVYADYFFLEVGNRLLGLGLV